MILDSRRCDLGEGPFWHPERGQLFWFDIINAKLLSITDAGPEEWTFPEMISAAGWVSRDELVIASESGLMLFNLANGRRKPLATISAGQPATRSNDGRADRQGGFWWGTMGKRGGEDPGRGAIWRYYRGQVRCLFPNWTIPNAICFAPDGQHAFFADTLSHNVMRVGLDAHGWPVGQPAVFLDLSAETLLPDGAVMDAAGVLWLAQWGSGRVAAYGPDGRFVQAVSVAAPHASCPAFGGPDLTTLIITTAREGMTAAALASHPDAGKTFAVEGVAKGLAEPRVIL
ncbi:MAG: SMP-30/gluconolactonase/LRE family protein [Paracoccaceae bacterium]